MSKTEQTTSPIFYDPTPANSPQLRQWAKDSMSLVLRDPARRAKNRYSDILDRIDNELLYLPSIHAAPEWERQAHDFSLFSIVEMHDPIMSPNSPFFDINAHKIWFSDLVDRWSFFVLQLGPPYAYRK